MCQLLMAGIHIFRKQAEFMVSIKAIKIDFFVNQTIIDYIVAIINVIMINIGCMKTI